MKPFHFSAIRARRVFVAMFRNRMSLVEKNADAYFCELDRLGIISNFESIKKENRREAIRIDIERKNGSLVDIAKRHGVSLRTVQRESALQRKFITRRSEAYD
ncbi:MAG: hypothetical protein OXG90_09735 [Gammaproteobacteria bacterium]|nr:hypothetical protein [Gammaproteobacteria bacterium]MCY3689246.1 hypothetical protein [Gammaproteobacteria bacterium]